jgi:hypothetical protein
MAEGKRRIALLGLFHETNTFSAIPADYDAFSVTRGEALLESAVGTANVIDGYIAGVAQDTELVPLMRASTGPIGIITADAYIRLTAEMFGMLREQGPWCGHSPQLLQRARCTQCCDPCLTPRRALTTIRLSSVIISGLAWAGTGC